MKYIINFLILTNSILFTACGSSDNEEQNVQIEPSSLELKWTLDTNRSESVVYDPSSNAIYTSVHEPDGYISKINIDGTNNTKRWFTNVRFPKGLEINNGKLYVTDNNATVVIDINSSNQIARYTTPFSTQGLNDISYDSINNVFYISNMSDDSNDTIYKMTPNGDYSLFYDEEGNTSNHNQNGVYVDNNLLIMQAIKGQIKSIDTTTKEVKIISSSIDNMQIDGITKYKDIGYFITGWVGLQNKLYFVNKDGISKLITNGDDKTMNDISYSKELDLLLVPSLGNKYVRAYKIK